jgi:16S rRNA (cytidine1402-2'-O)-methyltransferase
MTTGSPARGSLYLVPNALDLGAKHGVPPLQHVLPLGVIEIAARLSHWVAENAKTTRAFLKRVDAIVPLAQPLQAIDIRELPRTPKGAHAASASASPEDWAALLAPTQQGLDIGLISEAGLPAVADPGAALVAAAHRGGIRVVALPGPSSLLLALAASGLNGQSFAFVGYLPVDAKERGVRIRELEALSRRERQTQLMIETPYRNEALLSALLSHLASTTRLAVSCGLTLDNGFSRTDTVAGWNAATTPLPDDLPAVFSLLAAG